MSYQLAEDDDEAPPQPVFGPFLPSHDVTPSSDEPSTSSVSQTQKTVGCSAGPKPETDEKPNEKAENPRKGAEYDDEIQKLKALHEKYQKRSQQSKRSESKDADVGETKDASPVLVSSEVAEMVESFPEVASSTVESEVAREETVPTSDEQAFVRFEYTNRRYDGDDGEETAMTAEEMELDVDDIDKQLEMALERRQVSYTHALSVYWHFKYYYSQTCTSFSALTLLDCATGKVSRLGKIALVIPSGGLTETQIQQKASEKN